MADPLWEIGDFIRRDIVTALVEQSAEDTRSDCVQRIIVAAERGEGMWATIPAVWTAEIIALISTPTGLPLEQGIPEEGT
jgi:hypothetical protein